MRILIVTVAGMSTRFSRSIGYECVKCLYFRDTFRESLLYRLLHQPVCFDKYIIVGGYRFEELKATINTEFPEMSDRIELVENSLYAEYGSGYSLFCGLNAAFKYHFSQVVFAEGDLYVDAETFKQVCESPNDVVTVSPEPILAEKSVVFYQDKDDRIHYLYDTGHNLLFIKESFRAIYNSGQIWKFANPMLLRDVYTSMVDSDWQGTNLVAVERYFGQLKRENYEQLQFHTWVNCNTIEDFERLPDINSKQKA